jgi:hypothetical protein
MLAGCTAHLAPWKDLKTDHALNNTQVDAWRQVADNAGSRHQLSKGKEVFVYKLNALPGLNDAFHACLLQVQEERTPAAGAPDSWLQARMQVPGILTHFINIT